jgi:RNA polymerase sigma factor (sigma-70 family)
MVGDAPEPEPSVRALPVGADRLGAPKREHDAAFAKFYLDFMPRLVRFLRWQGVPFVDAENIAQDTLLQLYRHWPSVRIPAAWARRVASRRWGRQIADSHEHPVGDLALERAGTATLLTVDDILALEQRYEVVRLLDTLPSRQRQILAWTYEGYTPAEIAEELGLAPEAVRANLCKARRAAATYLGKEGR